MQIFFRDGWKFSYLNGMRVSLFLIENIKFNYCTNNLVILLHPNSKHFNSYNFNYVDMKKKFRI